MPVALIVGLHSSPDYQTVVDAFPRIAQKIDVFWGYPELVAYLRELQRGSDDRSMEGFPAEVLFAIHQLAALHDQQFPLLAQPYGDIWGTN